MIRRLALTLFFFQTTFLFSSNFHEHLFALPFPQHIAQEHRVIFSLPDDKQRLSSVFPTVEALHKKLSLQWKGKNIRAITLDTTLKTLCHALPGKPEENLLKLLTYTSTQKSSCTFRKFDYESCELLRKSILLSLPIDPFLRIYDAYFKQEPLINREIISATVTRRFFALNQQKKHVALLHLASSYHTRLIYRVSLQRNTLLKQAIALPKEVLSLLITQQIGGIDVVGSLQEATYTYPYTKHKIQSRLKTLFDFAHHHHLVIVFHLFEECNDDPFYLALKETLSTWNKPLFLEVGHIATINQEWIELFASTPTLHTLFHLNPQSNHLLHDTPISHLKKVAKHLLKKGLPVALGSDGRGILPASSYQEQKALFTTRFAFFSFLSLRENFFPSKYLLTKKWTESPEPVY